jgi:hypothetical protein
MGFILSKLLGSTEAPSPESVSSTFRPFSTSPKVDKRKQITLSFPNVLKNAQMQTLYNSMNELPYSETNSSEWYNILESYFPYTSYKVLLKLKNKMVERNRDTLQMDVEHFRVITPDLKRHIYTEEHIATYFGPFYKEILEKVSKYMNGTYNQFYFYILHYIVCMYLFSTKTMTYDSIFKEYKWTQPNQDVGAILQTMNQKKEKMIYMVYQIASAYQKNTKAKEDILYSQFVSRIKNFNIVDATLFEKNETMEQAYVMIYNKYLVLDYVPNIRMQCMCFMYSILPSKDVELKKVRNSDPYDIGDYLLIAIMYLIQLQYLVSQKEIERIIQKNSSVLTTIKDIMSKMFTLYLNNESDMKILFMVAYYLKMKSM